MKSMLVGVLLACAICSVSAHVVHGVSPIVISQLQTEDSLGATNEAVEIYNNTSSDHDISHWCIAYNSASSASYTSGPKYCFKPFDLQTKIFLAAQSYASIKTAGYQLPGNANPDGVFTTSGMSTTGGHIRLLDQLGVVQDTLGWGSASRAEGFIVVTNPAPSSPTATKSLFRKTLSVNVLQDTDDNRADFELRNPGMRVGGVYEIRIAVDVCGNVDGLQETLPLEYGYDSAGNCERLADDVCLNVALVQVEVPDGLMRDVDRTCHSDTCENIEGLQRTLPDGYDLAGKNCLMRENREIWLNEILPNVAGSDAGREFVELYNPNDSSINLRGYVLRVGKNLESLVTISSADDIFIPSHGYYIFYDDDLGITLLNTSNNLQLEAPAGNIVSRTSYVHPKEDVAWALISNEWQYTNVPTPHGANIPMDIAVEGEVEVERVTTWAACATGKYRHPITNRCRNIEADTSMLVACEGDEYRNPETNRCRKVTTLAASLTPCSTGYERNFETNRCRKVAGISTTLTPCQTGYERNPTTNRCRKTLSAASDSNESVAAAPRESYSLLKNSLIVTAGLSAVGYGLYEWRAELLRIVRRVALLISGK